MEKVIRSYIKNLVLLFIILFSFNLNANSNNSGIGIGPLYGYNKTEDINVLGLDLSLTGYLLPITVSLQPRLFLDDKSINYSLDLEFTVWLIFNIGGGIGYQSNNNENMILHLFLGLPIGTVNFVNKHLIAFKAFYIEPYYRYNYSGNSGSHEFGFLIKVNKYNFVP